MSTYFLRISSCISVVDGPVGFEPEKENRMNIHTIISYEIDWFAEQRGKSNM